MEEMEIGFEYIHRMYIKKITYEDLFNVISKYSLGLISVARIKPKNPREKYYRNMMIENANIYSYKQEIFQISTPVNVIFTYIKID